MLGQMDRYSMKLKESISKVSHLEPFSLAKLNLIKDANEEKICEILTHSYSFFNAYNKTWWQEHSFRIV